MTGQTLFCEFNSSLASWTQMTPLQPTWFHKGLMIGLNHFLCGVILQNEQIDVFRVCCTIILFPPFDFKICFFRRRSENQQKQVGCYYVLKCNIVKVHRSASQRFLLAPLEQCIRHKLLITRFYLATHNLIEIVTLRLAIIC